MKIFELLKKLFNKNKDSYVLPVEEIEDLDDLEILDDETFRDFFDWESR